MFEELIDQLPALILILVSAYPAWKGMKYFKFAKELLDIYISYKNSMKNGVFTQSEKVALADELIEAIESAKGLKKVKTVANV